MFTTSGEGGDAFRWMCPEPLVFTGLRGRFSAPAGAVSRVLASCGDAAGSTQPAALSPAFGAEADAPFELSCPPGTRAVGVFGNADTVVHALGLSCAPAGDPSLREHGAPPPPPIRTNTIGNAVGAPFAFACRRGQSMRALRGRAGALLDAIGIACRADTAAGAR